MTWFKIDDGFYDHPKVTALEESREFAKAIALWTLAGCWCARHLTDGHVPARQVRKLGFTPKQAQALEASGLWAKADDGWTFHDWTAHQPTRADVESKRDADRKRKADARSAAADSRRNPTNVRADIQPESECPSALPGPARPDPTRPSLSSPALAEFDLAHRAWAFAADRDPEPLRGKALDEATLRAKDVAKRLNVSLAQATGLLCDAAASHQKATGKPWAFSLREAQVKRGPAALSQADLDADLAVFRRGASQ